MTRHFYKRNRCASWRSSVPTLSIEKEAQGLLDDLLKGAIRRRNTLFGTSPSACCNVFHYLRQPVAALREMSRVLSPGGRLVITDWCDDYLACRVCDWYLRLYRRAHFKVYRQRECLNLLRETGQRDVDVVRYKISWLWGLMTARATKATGGAGPRDAPLVSPTGLEPVLPP
jgi:SAM-dependent methyltransferase